MKMRTIRTVYDRISSDMIVQLLLSYGIECVLRSPDQGGLRPHLAFTTGIEIIVSEEDYEKAIQILERQNK